MTGDRSAATPYQTHDDGVRLVVRLTPRAARDGLDGVVMGADGRPALQLRITASPVEGAANRALVAYLAVELKLRKSDIRIMAGENARLKRLELAGDSGMIAGRLADWIQLTAGKG
ncbi:MAG: DUF167 family protein [Caulobacteraceae bacterium]